MTRYMEKHMLTDPMHALLLVCDSGGPKDRGREEKKEKKKKTMMLIMHGVFLTPSSVLLILSLSSSLPVPLGILVEVGTQGCKTGPGGER
jgi:hypothetical protein